MFSLASGLYTQYFSPQQINLLVVGVKGVGKSTILERIKVTEFASNSSNAPLTVESAITTITTGAPPTDDALEPLNSKSLSSKTGPTPELLRTKIFLSENPHDFDAPARRSRQKKIEAAVEQPPKSVFSWICPPPPRFGAARNANYKDTSDRGSHIHVDDLDISEWSDEDDDRTDNHDEMAGDDPTDGEESLRETLSMCSEKPYEAARTRTMQRSNSNPDLNHFNQHHQQRRGAPPGLPSPRRISNTSRRDSSTGIMETIDLGPSPQNSRRKPAGEVNDNLKGPIYQYDLKPAAKMLPLEKIRPTIGMNLAKTEVCGAKVHVFDVSGKLQNLWERYYADADAVLFVWKLSRADTQPRIPSSRDDDTDSDDERPAVTVEQQKRALEQVRSAVADDVPFAILGHLFQTNPPYNCEPDVLYSTSQLLPHYHNPHQALFLGNAVTGQGLKTCLEWLIGAAKRQQRIRERQADLGKH